MAENPNACRAVICLTTASDLVGDAGMCLAPLEPLWRLLIFKVTNDVPINHYFLSIEGLPSDFYLLMTGFGTSLINGSREVPKDMPNFASQSQPPIPAVLSPAYGDTVVSPVTITWSAVRHFSGISGYELTIDEQVIDETTTEKVINLEAGLHTIQVRALNALDIKGGLSEAAVFTVLKTSTDIAMPEDRIPHKFILAQNYPNPFNPQTTIAFEIPHKSYVYIAIYNLHGQLVTKLVNDDLEAGSHRTIWKGMDQSGSHVAAGIYIYQIVVGDFVAHRKLLLLR